MHPRDILKQHDLAPNRTLGQNFLVSTELMDEIVREADIAPASVVLEIGTGLGRLTERLCGAARGVVSVEIDRGLWEAARNRLAHCSNLRLVHEDFLDSKHTIHPAVATALDAFGSDVDVHVVSNLPYQISSPAIINILEWDRPLVQMDVMLQAEVVDRLLADPGTSEYGPLTVFAGYHARMEPVRTFPPSAFWPPPQVSSKFIRICPTEPDPGADSYETFRKVVRKLFQSRRKTISKGLSLGWDKKTARAALDAVDWQGRRRPATLSVQEFVALANALNDVM